MAQSGKGRLNYRCPSCFKDKNEFYCMRCQFTGTEEDVLAGNEMVRTRYKAMHTRFTKFDFD